MWFRSWGINPSTEWILLKEIIVILFWSMCVKKKNPSNFWIAFLCTTWKLFELPQRMHLLFGSNQTYVLNFVVDSFCCKWDDTTPHADNLVNAVQVTGWPSINRFVLWSFWSGDFAFLTFWWLGGNSWHQTNTTAAYHLDCAHTYFVNQVISFWLFIIMTLMDVV